MRHPTQPRSAVTVISAASIYPDLLQIQRQPHRQLAAIQPVGVLQPCCHPLLAAPPDLHCPLLGQQKQAEANAIGLVDVHLAAQGRWDPLGA